MTDGAHLNLSAREAMGIIIGGDSPPDEIPSDEEFVARIRAAVIPDLKGYADAKDTGDVAAFGAYYYASTADATARLILEAFERYPWLQGLTDQPTWLTDANGNVNYNVRTNTTLTDVIGRLYPKDTPEGKLLSELSGFQWGWAVNAARKILDLGPVPNPAILTFTVAEKTE